MNDSVEVTAKHRFLKGSPRKVNLVVTMVRGLTVEEALGKLRFCPKIVAVPVVKTINSALANAQNREGSSTASQWVITTALANPAPTLHRWLAGSRGRAWRINKRRTHLVIGLTKS